MTTRLSQHYATTETSQKEPIPGKPMKQNAAGGFAFEVDDWTRLDRFLVLGTAGGSYYASERKLTVENAEVVRRCLNADGARTVARIVELSHSGRAPKNDQAIFALAMCLKLGSKETRKLAREAVVKVCRIGTHIFQLAETIKAFGGWGSGTKSAVCSWHEALDPATLALNMVKYQNRNGWSHKDLLRRSHSKNQSPEKEAIFRWVVCDGDLSARSVLRFEAGAQPADCRRAKETYERSGEVKSPLVRVDTYPAVDRAHLPAIIQGFEEMRRADSPALAVQLIEKYGLPRECVPTNLLNSVEVWEALLKGGPDLSQFGGPKPGMPMTAMIRNLGKMSEVGLLTPMSEASKFVCSRLRNEELLKKARIHPISVLLAQAVYAGGCGLRGNLAWNVDTKIVDALNDAFYKAFQFVQPTGKRHLLGLDVSGSMSSGSVAGTPLTPREAVGAMSLVTAKTEQDYAFIGYSDTPVPIDISPSMRLDTVCEKMARIPMGGTDAAIPMIYALEHKIPVDVFISYTDNETWAGHLHPVQALQRYRQRMGIPAKLIVVGVTATEISIADPEDAGMLDVVGFDAAAPEVMANFARD